MSNTASVEALNTFMAAVRRMNEAAEGRRAAAANEREKSAEYGEMAYGAPVDEFESAERAYIAACDRLRDAHLVFVRAAHEHARAARAYDAAELAAQDVAAQHGRWVANR